MRFMFCTAWPDAPFIRLSMTATTLTTPAAAVHPHGQTAEVRPLDLAQAGHCVDHLDERLVPHRRPVQLAERPPSRTSASAIGPGGQ